MEYRISLNDAIASDATLKSAANFKTCLNAFEDSFNMSGMASVLMSTHVQYNRTANILNNRIARGNTSIFTDLRSLITSVSEEGKALGIFIADPKNPEVKPLLDHLALRNVWAKIQVQEAIIMHHISKEQELLCKMEMIKTEIEIVMANRKKEPISGDEIVARTRLLCLLGFEEDDILAFVYSIYMNADTTKDLNRFLNMISIPDLFREHRDTENIMFAPPCVEPLCFKKRTPNNVIARATKSPESKMQTSKPIYSQTNIPRDTAWLPPVITNNLVPAVLLPVRENTIKKKKVRCVDKKQHVPIQNQDFGLAFL